MSSKIEELELKISYFLRYGVLVAGVLMLLGWLAMVDFSLNPFVEFSRYQDRPLLKEFEGFSQNRQWAFLLSYAGLFSLVSLPIIRVILTALLFIKESDRKMASFALFVFGILVLSFALGIHFE